MSMGRVFAKTEVGDQKTVRRTLFQRAECFLYNASGRDGFASHRIFAGRESRTGVKQCPFLRVRELPEGGHRSTFELSRHGHDGRPDMPSRPHKKWRDQTTRGHVRFR